MVGTAPQVSPSALSVVLLDPVEPVDVPAPEEAVLLDQLGRTFVPGLLVVRVGQPLLIRNSENDLHNVRILETETGEMLLNIGMLMGSTYVHTFERPGTYTVQCDIHTSMFADIVVTTTPYATLTDRTGQFSLPDVPPGEYTATVLLGKDVLSQAVRVGPDMPPLVLGQDG